MPPKKSSAAPTAPVVQQSPPEGMSSQLWELSKSTAILVEILSAQETENDIQQGCSKAEARSRISTGASSRQNVARLLWHEVAQKTSAGQQRRKEALENGIIDASLRALLSNNAAVLEPCAGLLNTLLLEAPESSEKLLAAPCNGVLTLWSVIGTGGCSVQTSAAGCLEMLLQAEHTSPRVLKFLEAAEWVVIAKALGFLVHLDASNRKDIPSVPPSSLRDTLSAVLRLMDVVLRPESVQQAASPAASAAGQAQKPPARAAQPAAKAAGRGKPQRNSGSLESSRQVLLERAAQSDTPTALLEICRDTGAEPRSRETAVRLVHALLTGRHWPTHHNCFAGTGCESLVSVLSAGDMSHASKTLAAATLKGFLLPVTPVQTETVPATNDDISPHAAIVSTAASIKAMQAGAQDKPQASMDSMRAQVMPGAALHQAMERSTAVMSIGALPILVALAGGVPESKSAKTSNDAAALQLEAISCLRLLSLVDTCKKLMGETGQAKLLLPLLTSKKNAVRWMTRQVLLNVATMEEAAEALERDGAPAYIHGMNIVRARRSCGQADRHSPQLFELQGKLYEQYSQA